MIERTRRATVMLALAISSAPVRAQDARVAPAAPTVRVIVEDAEGNESVQPLAEFDLAAALARRALFLRIEGAGEPQGAVLPAQRAVIDLVGGERIDGAVRTGTGDDVEVELASGARVTLNVDEIERLMFPSKVSEAELSALGVRSSGDRLIRAGNGALEPIDGTFEAFGAQGVEFDSVLGKKAFPWQDVAALSIEVAQERESESDGASRVALELSDGTRLLGELRAIEPRGVVLARRGDTLVLPLAWVDELHVADGRMRFLSELEPAESDRRSPFGDEIGLIWRHRVDRAVQGDPLRAGGRVWRRGLGVHAPSRLVWRLDGGWTALRGFVSLDDQVLRLPGRASVRFKVSVDGRSAWESPTLRAGDAPVEIGKVDLRGARELVLEVDPTEDAHVADRADWLRVYLVRG